MLNGTAASQGYRERKHEVGWFTILARVLIVLLVVLAVYVAYHNHQLGETQQGIIWGSVLLVAAIGLRLVRRALVGQRVTLRWLRHRWR